ncbi:phosphoglucosamine mutase [Candidatus Paracaedimonas acanthamoebae]|nr:phosphoglucosamine mutase [Candidatus Paracaedimonas acanthamoebae]
MSRKLFGTDGVRGTANTEPMTPETIMRLAIAAGRYFKKGAPHPKVVIGKDTRLSGYMVEPALTSGFIAVGMDVTLVGPIPTPAISMLVRSFRADLGVVISASHNPYHDNGIKLFDREGYKLSDAVEKQIEARVFSKSLEGLVQPADLGRAKRLEDATGRYIEFVKNTFPKNRRLDGLRIVIDCAHGAAYKVAPTVLWELGAEIIPIGVYPDGTNINKDVGATSVEAAKQAVLEYRADLGIALDGDADRVVMIDEKGGIIDGDQLLALIANTWSAEGLLKGGAVVGTVMTNLGFEWFLENKGLKLIRTPVGDRYVSEYMRAKSCNVGGEQSGHIILSDYARTGDGLVAALQALSMIIASNKPASEIMRVFEPVPQLLKSFKINNSSLLEDNKIIEAINSAEKKLGTTGRLLVRKSGTESLVRLMAQGDNEQTLHEVINSLSEVIYKRDANIKST